MTTTIADEVVVAIGTAATDNVALTTGIALAHLADLPLRLVHVTSSGEAIDVDRLRDHLQTTAPEVLVTIVSVTASDVVSGIVGELTPRSLVILKSTNASRWSGKASVAEHVLDTFPGLVAMVGPEVASVPHRTGPIVVALDGSAEAERAMPVAQAVAAATDTGMVATRIVPTSAGAGDTEEAAAYLDTVIATMANARPVVTTSNDPIAAILATAAETSAALIVLSSHGDRASERATISRTSMGLVHSATVPVVMVGPSVSLTPTR